MATKQLIRVRSRLGTLILYYEPKTETYRLGLFTDNNVPRVPAFTNIDEMLDTLDRIIKGVKIWRSMIKRKTGKG